MNNPVPRAQEILERHAGRETYPGDPWVPRYGATKAVAEALRRRRPTQRGALSAMVDAATEIDNGYRRCKLCKVTSYTGGPIIHNEHCPLPAAERALSRAAQGQAK